MKKMWRGIRSHWRAWTAIRYLSVVALSFWIAFLLRFDFSIPLVERRRFYEGLAIAMIAKITVCVLVGLDRERLWPYQGFSELVRLLTTNLMGSAVSCLLIFAAIGPEFPRSVYCLDLIVCVLLSGGARFAARLRREIINEWSQPAGEKPLLIYGAGVAGIALAREMRNNPKLGYKPVGFLDDEPHKKYARLAGLPVVGSGDEAARVTANYKRRGIEIKEIVISMPSATRREIRDALAKARAAGVASRVVPGLGELIGGKFRVAGTREISVNDLLGRDPIELDMDTVRKAISGQSVLVTGAAGSIGSELCAQLAQLGPQCVVAFDQAESELFFLEANLRKKYPFLNLVVEVGDIRDPRQVEHVITTYRINAIFHAAAYKHVPLMERQVCEAVRNNVLGTWNLVQTALRHHVSNFLLISTDKAVNPTSIMGLTKRVAELIVSASRPPLTNTEPRFVSVRFGNVLVSNGSVVPIFQRQIAAGGPVTVTHPDMRRYFMTVQEAVQLVLQAGTMGHGNEVFVLDMGEPVKIVDLANNMIKLSGFVPDEDIEIQFTGVRPGEKIFEEYSHADESTIPTKHSKIRVFKGRQITLLELSPWLTELQHLLWKRDSAAVVEHLSILVPEYQGKAAEQPAAPVLRRPATPALVIDHPAAVENFKTAIG